MDACHNCGEPGHYRRHCPHQSPAQTRVPAAAPRPSAGAPDIFKAADVSPCAMARRRVLYFGWGEKIAAMTGGGRVVRTPFRDRARLAPKTEGQLRALALEQVAEARAARGR